MSERTTVMTNASWVCFDCREAVRRPTRYRREVPCPRCGKNCRRIGYKIPVPPKRAIRSWKMLHDQLVEDDIKTASARHARSVRQRHDIEQELRKLMALTPNAGRSLFIAELRKRLEDAGDL